VYAEEKPLARFGNFILARLLKSRLAQIDRFVYNSLPSHAYGRKYLGVESVKLPHAIVTEGAVAKTRTRTLKLLFLGRLEKRKGVLDLLAALRRLKAQGLDRASLEVCIAGDGPDRPHAEALAQSYGLENIRFRGRVSETEKRELYHAAHLAVFPAAYGESFGIVLMEAMNFGCATYGYANPGYTDAMGPFAGECLSPPGDVAGLAALLERCIANPEEYVHRMGARQKEYCYRTHDLERVGARVLELYRG
jgi:glycosyltransferase involved in cell wall biosynthesis